MMFTHVSRSLLWGSALIALAQGLPAADGVTLIDQFVRRTRPGARIQAGPVSE